MPLLEVGRSCLYYEVHGAGSAVVLAHGVGGNHAIWYQQTAHLSRTHKVIVFDHRGFGRSTDVEGLGRAAFASDLTALLDHLEIEKAALVGQSMGGGTCIGFAAQAPKRVTALVLASTLHALDEPAEVKALMDAARTASAGLSQLNRVLGINFRAIHPEGTTLYAAINSFNIVDRKTLTGVWPVLVAPQHLAALNIPILFIAASDDVLFPAEAIRRMCAHVSGAAFVEFHQCGHSSFFECPTQFNTTVLQFLELAQHDSARELS